MSLQDLIDKFSLSNELLDVSLSEEDLTGVSKIIDDHTIPLGPELGLTPEEMAAISLGHPRKTSRIMDDCKAVDPEPGLTSDEMTAISLEQPQSLGVLKKWKQVSAWKATYRKLIEALLKCSRADLANKMCELLAHGK